MKKADDYLDAQDGLMDTFDVRTAMIAYARDKVKEFADMVVRDGTASIVGYNEYTDDPVYGIEKGSVMTILDKIEIK
jgi:hypothetical protein